MHLMTVKYMYILCIYMYMHIHVHVTSPLSLSHSLSLSVKQAPYLLHIEVVECEGTYLSPLPAKLLDVSVQSAGLNSSLAGVCVRSEGASPSSMRATSISCLTETEMTTNTAQVSVYSYVHHVQCVHVRILLRHFALLCQDLYG